MIDPLVEVKHKIQKDLAQKAQYDVTTYAQQSHKLVKEVQSKYGIQFNYVTPPKEIRIEQATQVSDYKLKLKFNDGHENIVDFEPFLKTARHPDIRKYLKPALFKQFEIRHGNLDWNHFDLCFPIADLYEGTLVKTPVEVSDIQEELSV